MAPAYDPRKHIQHVEIAPHSEDVLDQREITIRPYKTPVSKITEKTRKSRDLEKHDKTRERPSHRHRNWNSLTFSKFRVTVGVTVCDGVTV